MAFNEKEYKCIDCGETNREKFLHRPNGYAVVKNRCATCFKSRIKQNNQERYLYGKNKLRYCPHCKQDIYDVDI